MAKLSTTLLAARYPLRVENSSSHNPSLTNEHGNLHASIASRQFIEYLLTRRNIADA